MLLWYDIDMKGLTSYLLIAVGGYLVLRLLESTQAGKVVVSPASVISEGIGTLFDTAAELGNETLTGAAVLLQELIWKAQHPGLEYVTPAEAAQGVDWIVAEYLPGGKFYNVQDYAPGDYADMEAVQARALAIASN